ncbi:MAG: hypothetical protein L3K06_00030 [Thermoplasmata archaeon]|nr:hypothetical protein [Thermoplasmata archaeon]MCI4353737.1 hypothetical protein [Thermoplasmata archaeon]
MRPMVSPARAKGTDVPTDAERTHAVRVPLGRQRPRTIGRLRLPIALTVRPWATLYGLPDGRRYWCVRLWEEDRAVRRCFSTGYLVAFARLNRLDALRAEIEEIDRRP